MKPPVFEYHRPETVAEALAVLAEVGHDGKVLAGGQSLVPLLNMRLAAPAHLVDVNRLAELDEVGVDGQAVRVGALARHARVEHDQAATDAVPLLGQAIADIAHTAIRNRGTVVGSLVHADPAAELPAVLVLLGGTMELAAAGGGPGGWPRPTSSWGRWSRPCGRGAGHGGGVPAAAGRQRQRLGGGGPPPRRLRRLRGRGAGRARPGAADRLGPGGADLGRAGAGAGRPDRRPRRPAPRRRRLGRRRAPGRGRRRPRGRHPRQRRLPPPPGRGPDRPGGPGGRRPRRHPAPRWPDERGPARDPAGGQRGAAHRAGAGAAAAGRLPAPRPGADRHPPGLRARRLRGLHGAGRRAADALLPAVRRRGGRGRDHHRGGLPGARRRPRPGAAGLPGLPRAPVRLLHPRVRHHRHRLAGRAPRPHRGAGPRGHRRQPLPLHRLPEHRRLGPPGRRDPPEGAP